MLNCFRRVYLFATPETVAHQAPLSMGFSRQEYWSGVPFPLPGDLPDPRIEPASLPSPALAGRFFTPSAIWETHIQARALDICRSPPLGDTGVLECSMVEIHLPAGARWRGWGEAKMASPEKRKKERKAVEMKEKRGRAEDGTCQPPSPEFPSRPLPLRPTWSKQQSPFHKKPGPFSKGCFCAGPWRRWVSAPALSLLEPCVSCVVCPAGFQNQMLGGLVFQEQVLKAGVSNVGYKPFTPQ